MATRLQFLLSPPAPSGVAQIRPHHLRAFSVRPSNSSSSPLDSAVPFAPVLHPERGGPPFSNSYLPLSSKGSRIWRSPAASGGVLTPETAVDQAQSVLPAAAAGDGSGSTVVSVLLTIAFVGLSILTAGVIYIAVTDFLRKREREKFEKQEAINQKKGGKKKKKAKVKARAGPRGFGQKIEDDDKED